MSGPTSNCSLVETEARGGEVTCPNLHGVEWQNWDWNWLQSCSLSPRSARLGLEEALDTPVLLQTEKLRHGDGQKSTQSHTACLLVAETRPEPRYPDS